LIDIDNFFNNDVIMSPLADGCVQAADTTQLDFAIGTFSTVTFVQNRRDYRQLVANCVHTADATHDS